MPLTNFISHLIETLNQIKSLYNQNLPCYIKIVTNNRYKARHLSAIQHLQSEICLQLLINKQYIPIKERQMEKL